MTRLLHRFTSVLATGATVVLLSPACVDNRLAPTGTSPADSRIEVVAVEPAAAQIAVGESAGLRSVVTLRGGGRISGLPVVWSSSNPAVATVDETSGLVRGVAVGTATITATVEQVSGTATVSVGAINELAMIVARAGHTARLLPDGRVLIFGGVAETVRPQAEVYDPASRRFSAADGMIVVRGGHQAARLPDGTLLFLEGVVLQDRRTFFAGPSFAELYDPASATLTRTADYPHSQATRWSTTTLLLDGRVLLTGYTLNGLLAVTELFDPGSGTFSVTGPMQAFSDTPGWGTLLSDGTVLFVQWNFNFPPDAIELYDPAAGTFRLNGRLNTDYAFSRAVRLADGRVLITGGQMPGGNGTRAALLYVPGLRGFLSTDSMSVGRHSHTATLLRDGTVLVTGGYRWWPGSTASAEIIRPPATP